ncbi:hypothetical protein [Kribbella sp. CA-294648]|uniref:hypothetical protein n=1 Tax=Kribbella sp. CA-294648 TaxID=3239948 RepID=UPI003D919E77
MFIAVTAVAVGVVCASTSNAAGPVVQGGDPKDPAPPTSSGFPQQTPVQKAVQELTNWTWQHPASGMASVGPGEDGKSVVVHWKGTYPSGLKALAASQPVPVMFRPAAYSGPELSDLGKSLLDSDPNLAATWATPGYSGLTIRLKPNASSTALSSLRARTTVPITSAGVEHSVSLRRTALPAQAELSFPSAVRPADRAPFYGGALVRKRGVSSACSTGAALVAGTHEYMTTAAHCGAGTWVSYDQIGTAPSAVLGAPRPEHISEAQDIQLIETDSFPRIWHGRWDTSTSRIVEGAYMPGDLAPVVASGGVAGSGVYPRSVTGQWAHWEDTITGATVGPGFIATPRNYTTLNGAIILGDSGSPTIASFAGGQHVYGFVSKGYSAGIGTVGTETPLHPGFKCGSATPCFAAWYSVYALSAINIEFDGLSFQTS